MAYTLPVQLTIGQAGVTNAVAITGTGVQTPFAIAKESGRFWGQATFVAVLTTVTTFTANLEVDLTNTDANFTTLFTGLDFKTVPAVLLNLNGGNARYRWNVITWVGTSANIYGIVG